MGFDQNVDQPIVQPRRWGTKVNFGIIGGVLLFVVFGILAMHWVDRNKDQVSSQIQQQEQAKPPAAQP